MPTSDLLNEIKMVLDISSRVDERVKMIQASQSELGLRMHQLVSESSQLGSRVSVLESKNGNKSHELEGMIHDLETRVERIDVGGTSMYKEQYGELEDQLKEVNRKLDNMVLRLAALETSSEGWTSKFRQYSHLLIQGIWVVIVCYVLYKLGLNTPPLP